jgi:hypothetical protein
MLIILDIEFCVVVLLNAIHVSIRIIDQHCGNRCVAQHDDESLPKLNGLYWHRVSSSEPGNLINSLVQWMLNGR